MERKLYYTDRLVLKTLTPEDAPMALDYFVRNREFLREWEPVRDEEFYTLPVHEKALARDLSLMEERAAFRLWVFQKGEEERVIGSVGFNNIVWGCFLSCHLGYKSDQDALGRGYMTEAVRKGIDVMFAEYGLHRIEANIMPKNQRSLRLTERLDFSHEGLARKYLKINGIWEDHIHMVLLNDMV